MTAGQPLLSRLRRRGTATAARRLATVLAFALLLCGCGREYGSLAEARAAYARDGLGPVVIAAVEDPLGPSFAQGIELAVAEINAADDGLLGRPLRVRRFPGSEHFQQARGVARQIAEDPRISVVLGHRRSEVAVPASVIYERAQVLFLPSFATAEQLTRHGFEFVLRTLPDNAVMAAQTASVVELFGHRRIAVLHGREDYARELAFLFQDEARARGLDVVFSASFFERETNYRGILGQLNAVQFDAIYLSADHAAGARLVRQLRELGFAQPVFGSDRLAYGDFDRLAGAAADRTVAPSVYSSDAPGPRNRAFVEAYRAAYGIEPDQGAAQGYDSARLFADIVRTAGSTEPQVLATTARYAPPWAGVTGIFAYDPRGNVHSKLFEFRVLRFGRWWSLPGVTAPFRLASFRAARAELARQDQADATEVASVGDDAAAALKVASAVGVPPVQTGGTGAEQATAAAEGVAPAPVEPGPDAATSTSVTAEPAAPAQALGLDTLTSARLSAAERDRIWLSLAHEILRFGRLGVIVPPSGRGTATVGLARTVAAERGFDIEICELPAADPVRSEPLNAHELTRREREGVAAGDPMERAAVRCWSRLSRQVDALLIVPDSGLRPALVRRLNRTLRGFGVPAFALARELDTDLALTLALVATGIDLDDPQVALRFDGVLRGLRVHALNRKLTNLPAVSADLGAFADLGIRPDPRLLTLVSRAIEPDFRAARTTAAPAQRAASPAADQPAATTPSD